MNQQCVHMSPEGRCPWTSTSAIAGVALCGFHERQLKNAVLSEVHSSRTAASQVVYYAGHPETQLVKIGYTEDLKARLGALRGAAPGLLLLAFEPGSMKVEKTRHRQFRTLCDQSAFIGSREWFRRAPILMDHIRTVRRTYGIDYGVSIPGHWVAPLQRPVVGPTPLLESN